jgi:5-methyltetrahydrofolate--homocysteine methyltransferase
MALFRKGLYHLDGPGELTHLDLLCTIPNLHAIQWVPGPAIGFLDDVSFALYRRIIEKGKKVVLSGFANDPDAFRRLFRAFPREAFLLTTAADDYEQAMRIASFKAGPV